MQKRHGIEIVCFDLNKTLIKENSWLDLNIAMGVTKKEDQKLFDQYYSGKITYKQWQKELQKLYKKRGRASKENIEKSIYNYTYVNGSRDLIDYLKSVGYEIFLLSGSIDLLTQRVAQEFGIEKFAANNKFVFDNNYLQAIVVESNDSDFKLDKLKEVCKSMGIATEKCVCVGDGDNDRKIFEETGRGITFTNSSIIDSAWKVVDDLISIKNIL